MTRKGIFVNYRQNRHKSAEPEAPLERLPHAQLVEAISDRLRWHFGTHAVFVDTTIRKGAHYPSELRLKLDESEVLIAVIHPSWVDDLNDRRGRLVDKEYDWVHWEISEALRVGIRVMPLLIGDAELPKRGDLPEDLRNMTYPQAHSIRFGYWEQDIRLLIQALENYVAAESTLRVESPKPPEPRSRSEFVAMFVVGALLPVMPTWLLVDTAMERSIFLMALMAVMLLMMILLTGAVSLLYASRRWLDTVDDATARIAQDQKGAVIIGGTIASFATVFLFTDNSFDSDVRMLLLAVIVGIAVTFGAKWVLKFRTPQEWPNPKLDAVTTSIRAELNHVAKHISDHQPLLNRLQRDQALFALRQIETTTEVLARLAARNQREWLRAAVPWGWANALLCGVMCAGMVGALVAYWSGGGTAWWALWLTLLGLVIALASQWGSLVLAFRRQRWHFMVIVEQVPPRLAELRDLLTASSVPPSEEARQGEGSAVGDPGGGDGLPNVDGRETDHRENANSDHDGIVTKRSDDAEGRGNASR